MQQKSIDYVTPQLYWAIGSSTNSSHPHNTDYAYLMPWWGDSASANGRHFYPGHIFGSFTTSELPNQVKLDRANPKVQGGVFFRASHFSSNTLTFPDSLKNTYFKYLALSPVMTWRDTIRPLVPRNLRFERIPGATFAALRWDAPSSASDGDSASRYVVYRLDHQTVTQADLDNPVNMISIEGTTQSVPNVPTSGGPFYYAVSALDRNFNESAATSAVLVSAPVAPLLASPADGALGQPVSVTLVWNHSSQASSYRLQVSKDPTFASSLLVNDASIIDSFRVITGMEGQTRYYWRLNASNSGGTGSYSVARSFVTGFPAAPVLASPANISLDVEYSGLKLSWNKTDSATSYRLQVSKDVNFTTLFLDTAGVADTSFTVYDLSPLTIYNWHVIATNDFGNSLWSTRFNFRTKQLTFVSDLTQMPLVFELQQNYPNPFNPETNIRFTITESNFTTLKIYNILGSEIATLVNGQRAAGTHTVMFQAKNLTSGVYIYRLTSGSHFETKKMVLVK